MKITEQEAKVIVTIAEALPKMTEFEKGYFLGFAEGKTNNKPPDKEEETPVA